MRAATSTDPDPRAAGRRLRVALGAALASVLTSFVFTVLLAALTGATAGAPPAPLAALAAGLPLWLAAHQVPLTVTGAPLGALPLLPTLGVLLLTANFAAAAIGKLGRRWGGEAAWVVAAVAGAHASLAVLSTALPTDPIQAEPWAALLGAGLVAAAGAGLGVLRAAGAPAWWPAAPSWLRTGVASAATGAAALSTAGALLLVAALVADIGTVHDGFAMRPGFGPGIGIAILSICYLPNAVVAAVSWLAGPGVIIGSAVASPLGVSVGALPPLPLLAAMPTSRPPDWAGVVFVLPVAAGVLIGLGCRRSEVEPIARLRAVAVAVVAVAAGFTIVASVVSGRLAAGPFDPVELPVLSGALALLVWLGVPAAVASIVPAGRRSRSRRPTRVADLPDVRRRRTGGVRSDDARADHPRADDRRTGDRRTDDRRTDDRRTDDRRTDDPRTDDRRADSHSTDRDRARAERRRAARRHAASHVGVDGANPDLDNAGDGADSNAGDGADSADSSSSHTGSSHTGSAHSNRSDADDSRADGPPAGDPHADASLSETYETHPDPDESSAAADLGGPATDDEVNETDTRGN